MNYVITLLIKVFGQTFIVIAIIATIIAAIARIIGWWAIFSKMGVSGWKSLIPIYNTYNIYRKVWSKKAFWLSLLLNIIVAALDTIPLFVDIGNDFTFFYIMLYVIMATISFFVNFKLMASLSVNFGHGVGYTFGLVFLQTIFVLIIGFGDSKFSEDY